MMDDSDMGSMHDDMDDMMMNPNKGIPLDGEIVIEVLEANGLTNKEDSDMVGDLSDPYCAIFLDRMEKNRTKTLTNTLNPTWNEKFSLVVKGKYEDLVLQVFDYDPKKTISDHLGLAQVDLKGLTDEKKRDQWIPLAQNKTVTGNTKKDKVTGNLHIKIQYLARGGEEKRKAEKELSNTSNEVEALKKQLEETKLKLQNSQNEEKVQHEKDLKEKEQLLVTLQQKENELKKKAEEEKQKLIEQFNKQSELEKQRTEKVTKEKEEAEKKLKEALEMIEKIKKEIQEHNKKERELLNTIEEEKERERKLELEIVKNKRTDTNVTNIPTVNFGGDFKPKEMAQPNKLFAEGFVNVASEGNTIYALKPTGEITAISTKGIVSPVPGRLINIGVGSDGTLMGTDPSLGIWKWTGSSWHKLPGLLQQISVGNENNVWGVGFGGAVWKYDGHGQRWSQMPGRMRWISVGGDGEVWGISTTGEVYRWENDSWRQTPLANAMVVTVSTKENIWAITEEGVLNQFQGSSWKAFPDWGKFRFVDIADESLFVIDSNNNIYSSAIKPKSLVEKIALPRNAVPGKLKSVSAGGSILGGVDPEGKIWIKGFSEGNWTQLPGLLNSIAVGEDDDIWGCTPQKQLFRWQKDKKQWIFSGALVNVSVGNANLIAGVGEGDSLWRSIGGRWEKLPGAGTQISVGEDGELWVRNGAGQVYRWVNSNWQYIPSPPASFVSVGNAKNVVIQNQQDKTLYFYDGTTWFPIKDSAQANYKEFSLNNKGNTFAVNQNNEIFSSL